MRVMVTGAAGFIGSHLVDRLQRIGHDVTSVDDLSTGRWYGPELVRMDVRSPAFPLLVRDRKPELIFHLAAQSGVRPSILGPITDADINILGSLRVMQGARIVEAKVVYAASGGTLYREDLLPSHEDHLTKSRPRSPYGISKKVPLDYLKLWEDEVPWTALALANVYGPRQGQLTEAGVVSIFAAAALDGERPTIFGDGRQTRDFVYVDDVVEAFILAMTRGNRQLINVGSGEETSVLELWTLVSEVTGFTGEPQHADPITGEVRRSVLQRYRAMIQLNWKPTTSLREGVVRTVDSLR